MFMEILRWIMTIVGIGMVIWVTYEWVEKKKLDAYIDGWFSCAERKQLKKINEIYKEVKEENGL